MINIVQLYSELFTRILFPPSRVTDSADPYSLQVQIEALIQVLSAKDVWLDFSMVEWRIRLGQILWGPPIESDSEDDIILHRKSVPNPGSQKYWLLLQILLSCELLLRLDAISINVDHYIEEPKPEEIKRFDRLATTSIRWSIILARFWLENIQIVRTNPGASAERAPTTAAGSGWMATLTETLTGAVDTVEAGEFGDPLENVQFHGRHQERQLKGLIHFARKLKWPDLDALTSKVSSHGISLSDTAHSTPTVGTPISSHHSNSYFSIARPGIKRGTSKTQTISALIHPDGWLSNSYISGLILPGEGLSHFLISTLLEHDDVAISKLGQEANLYGGFVYSNRSFWSTACILGRVLAAGQSGTECMGWISSDILPKGAGEAWVNIDVEHLPASGKFYLPTIWSGPSIVIPTSDKSWHKS